MPDDLCLLALTLAESSWLKMQIALLGENVEPKYLQDVTVALGFCPVRLEAVDICDARRPCFYWCSWELFACDEVEKVLPTERSWNVQPLNREHGPARWLDHRTGMAPKIYPRKTISVALCKRQPGCRNLEKFADLIDVLEAIMILQSLKWRARASSRPGSHFLHLINSFVPIAVLRKYRSSSCKLNRGCQPALALVLSASFHSMYGFARSDDNPADCGSRS